MEYIAVAIFGFYSLIFGVNDQSIPDSKDWIVTQDWHQQGPFYEFKAEGDPLIDHYKNS